MTKSLPFLSWLPFFSVLYIEGVEGVAVMRYRVGRVIKPEANIAASQSRRKSRACPSHAPSPHTSASPHRPVLLLTFIADDCSLGGGVDAFTLSTSLIITHLKRFAFYVFISHKVEPRRPSTHPQRQISALIWCYIERPVPVVHEDVGLLLWGPSFGRLANGIRSTAPPVPMNFSLWMGERERHMMPSDGGGG